MEQRPPSRGANSYSQKPRTGRHAANGNVPWNAEVFVSFAALGTTTSTDLIRELREHARRYGEVTNITYRYQR